MTLANLLDGKVTEPKWNYRNLALGGADSDGYSIDDGIAYYQSNVNGNVPPTRKNVRRLTVTEPWGAYYRTYGGQEPGLTMSFTGGATDGMPAHSAPTRVVLEPRQHARAHASCGASTRCPRAPR